MSKITITEALAEIPTIIKRIEKKQQFIQGYLYRQSAVRDPHEKDGGSALLIEKEMQSIKDLQNRIIAIRSSIQLANNENTITVEGETKSISDWLTWRREIAQIHKEFLGKVSGALSSVRNEAMRKGIQVSEKDNGNWADIVVNINEKELAEKIEKIEVVLGTLDGQLSLKNATIVIELP